MKKIFYLAAAMSIAMFASCEKQGDEGTNEPEAPEAPKVTVAEDALVLHLPFEDGSVAVGEGVTFASKVGKADFVDGFIGKAYTNTSGDAKEEGYLKYTLAESNAVKSLKSFTFTSWVKRPALGSGTFFSVNGGEHDWGSTMQFFFDNTGVGEDGATYQQFNARIDSYKEGEDGVKFQASCWPNVQGPEFATLDKWFQVARTYDAATGAWKVYVDGVMTHDGVHEYGDPVGPFGDLDLNSATMNALYIGGWAAIIDGVNNQDWMTFFNGSVDEVRMYNRALTDQEIGELWQQEKLINLE